MLKPADLEEFRKTLLLIRARVRGDIEQLEEEAFGSGDSGDARSSNHIAEMGSDAWNTAFSLRIAESDQEMLSEVNDALQRIEAGTYGLCEACIESGVSESKASIPKGRLKAIPYARHCVKCASALEKGR